MTSSTSAFSERERIDGLGILLRDVAVAQGQAHHAGIFALGQGVGLGLSVSREIAREHGGDLSLKGDGAGAVQFSLLLPL